MRHYCRAKPRPNRLFDVPVKLSNKGVEIVLERKGAGVAVGIKIARLLQHSGERRLVVVVLLTGGLAGDWASGGRNCRGCVPEAARDEL